MIEYLKCNSCDQIEPKEVWVTPYLTKECMYCSNNTFEKWPSQDIQDLLNLAVGYDQNNDHYSLVTSVFISTALELMLENLINLVFSLDEFYEEVYTYVNMLLDSYQGRSRRLLLFKKLNGRSFGVEANNSGNKNFMKHWDGLTNKRNKLVHGVSKEKIVVTPKQVSIIVDESLDVFNKLHNKINVESPSYHYSMEKGKSDSNKPSSDDLHKLLRWMNKDIDTNN